MKISVIIPALNESSIIHSSILSIKKQKSSFEIIVVDGGSTDNTVAIVKSEAFVITGKKGRAIQMNAGVSQSTGEVLLFLHADTILHPDAFAYLHKTIKNPHIVGGTFTLRFDSNNFFLRLYSFFTRFRFRYFHYGDQGIFVRRSIFDQLGGFREIPIMEDIDFLRRLNRRGKVALVKVPVTTSARRFLKRGVVCQQLINIMLVLLYLLGVKPQTISKWYPGR